MNEILDKPYKDIIERVEGGMIYGVNISLNDIRALVVAAYWLGRQDESAAAAENIKKRLGSMFAGKT